MRKIFFFFLVLIFMLTLRRSFAEEIVQDVMKHLKSLNIQTGDLLFWATNEIGSVLIQKFTDGPYSHAGVLSVTSDGGILIYDVHPSGGLRKSLSEDHFGADESKIVRMAVIRYNGTLNREELLKRLDEFWIRKSQIQFDHSMALEKESNYNALLQGKLLQLYCTEFLYRLYEGLYKGSVFFENDFSRVYGKKDIFRSLPPDTEIFDEFARWQGVHPVEKFQEWLALDKNRVLITVNGMLRGGGFEVLYEKSDETRFKPWAVQLLEMSVQDSSV